MLKKIIFLSLIAVAIVSKMESQELENFDKGDNFGQCLDNCRQHHREELQLPRAAGRGSCWDICSAEHLGKQTEIIKKEYPSEMETVE